MILVEVWSEAADCKSTYCMIDNCRINALSCSLCIS